MLRLCGHDGMCEGSENLRGKLQAAPTRGHTPLLRAETAPTSGSEETLATAESGPPPALSTPPR